MTRRRRWLRATSVALVVAGGLKGRVASAADQATVEQLVRELEAMKQRLEKVEKRTQEQDQTIRRQSETIRQLSGGTKVTPAGPAAVATRKPPAGGVEKRTVVAATDLDAHDEALKREVTENIMRRIQPSLAGANKTFASQFNPAIGFIVDTVGSYRGKQGGSNFEFRSGELGISASVDPFVRGYAILNGTQDGVEVEEAAIATTSLPYNLAIKGGRFFADFGRLSKFHDHDLPFVNRPHVLDEYVGGESQGDGVEASWLVPLSQYLTLTAGTYNKIGAENERVSNDVPRNFSENTYLGRAATFFSLSDANSIDLGVSGGFTPRVKEDGGSDRILSGVDLTYRYSPLSQAAYRGLVWGTEVLMNSEDRPVGGFPDQPSPTPLDFRRKNAVGLYSYLEPRLTRRFYPGFLFEWVQDVNPGVGDTLAYSPYFTIWASEFQRLRLQYTRLESPGLHENEFFVQWTVILGSHVHSFKDR
jgi:hypothetical protein